MINAILGYIGVFIFVVMIMGFIWCIREIIITELAMRRLAKEIYYQTVKMLEEYK